MHQILGIFCVVGFGVGIGVIYVMDLLDDRLRSPEEVREQLGLPVLAVIRKLPEHEVEQARIYVHGFPQTPHAECFRTLKTSLTLSALETKCLAITSTEASEGKTTTTVNLAASYAQTGIRTLLIDADMRRPGLSRLLEIRGQGGLSEVLRAESDIGGMARERIVQTDVPLLDVLPCGPRILNAGMLLSMPTLPDLLDWAVSEYDQVIVDCPPTLPVSDAAIVGRYVDGMLFLMNPDKTHRRSVVRAVDQLRSMELKVVGVVANTSLNEEKSGYGYQYGYGYGYGSDYSYGHDDEDEPYNVPEPSAQSATSAQSVTSGQSATATINALTGAPSDDLLTDNPLVSDTAAAALPAESAFAPQTGSHSSSTADATSEKRSVRKSRRKSKHVDDVVAKDSSGPSSDGDLDDEFERAA